MVSLLNPFYPDLNYTVISCDLIESSLNNYISPKYNNESSLSFLELEINKLLTKYHSRRNYIFNTNGDIRRFQKNGILFSSDEKLNILEMKINDISVNNFDKMCHTIIENGSQIFLEALQWHPKNDKMLTLLFLILKNGDEKSSNICLLQFIPIVKNLDIDKKKLLANILVNDVLIRPSSLLRNKSLSLLSELIPYIEINKSFLDFCKTIAKSKQFNCSYPAEEIFYKLYSTNKSAI